MAPTPLPSRRIKVLPKCTDSIVTTSPSLAVRRKYIYNICMSLGDARGKVHHLKPPDINASLVHERARAWIMASIYACVIIVRIKNMNEHVARGTKVYLI